MELLDKLELKHLAGDHRQIAEAIGIENYRSIVRMFAGSAFYVPTIDKLTIKIRDEEIKAEYNGTNYRPLAQKWGISEQWVRMIVSGEEPKPIDGQVCMFG